MPNIPPLNGDASERLAAHGEQSLWHHIWSIVFLFIFVSHVDGFSWFWVDRGAARGGVGSRLLEPPSSILALF